MPREANAPAILWLAAAAALMTAACVAWGHSYPGPGDRALPEGFVVAMRGLAVALGAAAQGVALWLALPSLLKRRAIYPRLAAACGAVATCAGLVALVANWTR